MTASSSSSVDLSVLQLLLAITLAFAAGQLVRYLGSSTWIAGHGDCSAEEFRINLSSKNDTTAIHLNVCQLFSDDYATARQRFRTAVQELGSVLSSQGDSMILEDSLPIEINDGDDSTTCAIDVAVIPGNQPGLVIHSSGVHGIEGYSGSAIQIAAVKALTQLIGSSKSKWPRPTLLLIHAVNPYGMAHYRRFNEHNVDLNRNGLTPAEWKTYAIGHYNKANYNQFDGLFNPQHAPTWYDAYIDYWVQAVKAIYLYGQATLKAAMVAGQYHLPKSLFYGGSGKVEASLQVLGDWLQNHIGKDWQLQPGKNPAAVTWVDVHTGLGKFGQDTMLPNVKVTDAKIIEAMRTHLDQWFPDSHNPFAASGADVMQGYENVKFTGDYFQSLIFPDLDESQPFDRLPLLVTQEFGTLPQVLVGRALILENAAYHHYHNKQERLEWAKRVLRPAFYPNHPHWRRAILSRGFGALHQAMQRSIQYGSASGGHVQEEERVVIDPPVEEVLKQAGEAEGEL